MIGGRDLALEVIRQLDETRWIAGYADENVQIYSSRELPAPVIGYRTVTEHVASLDDLSQFLGAEFLTAFSTLNARFAFGETLLAEPLVVRTGFTMPAPFRGREFVHSLVDLRVTPDCHVVAYGPVDESPLPPARDGFLRCVMYPSGQRILRLDNGRTRVEHLMTYELAGAVPRWAQNTLFHKGHLGAYRDEWTRLVRHFSNVAGQS